MDKEKLKKILKPLINECVREAIYEQGILSGIVSEVVRGLNTNVITEQKTYKQTAPKRPAKKPKQLQNTRKKLLDAIGKDAYGGINLFEGTTPALPEQSSETAVSSPLSGIDPGDAGIDISGIVALGGKNWKALAG